MTVLADDEVIAWCAKRGITLDREARILSYASYPQDWHTAPYVDLPETRGRVMRMADSLVAEDELHLYYGSLLWVCEWSIFENEDTRTGIKLVTQFASGYGRNVSLHDGTGYLFDPTERIDQAALLAAVMLCQWDAWLVPNRGQYAIFLSHDGFADIIGDSPEIVAEHMERSGLAWKAPRR